MQAEKSRKFASVKTFIEFKGIYWIEDILPKCMDILNNIYLFFLCEQIDVVAGLPKAVVVELHKESGSHDEKNTSLSAMQ